MKLTGTCEFQWSPEGPVSQTHPPHLQAGAPRIFSNLLRSVQMLKKEWGAERNGKLPHLFIHSKTSTFVPEFAEEDLSLSRTAALVPEFAVKVLPLGKILWWWRRHCGWLHQLAALYWFSITSQTMSSYCKIVIFYPLCKFKFVRNIFNHPV